MHQTPHCHMPDQAFRLSDIESHLWESANILRGPVDAADFKTYIFPLLFFKRICDVWDDEYQEIVDETGDEATGVVSRIAPLPDPRGLPLERCARPRPRTSARRCSGRCARSRKPTPTRCTACSATRSGPTRSACPTRLLKDLIEHFSRLPLGNHNVTSDLLGDAYEYLIKKFADATNKKAGEFYTPRSVVRLMIDMLDPKEAETIYDPACGTGGMLLAAVQHVKEMHGDVKRLWGKLYGQEKNLTTSSIARMNLFLHGIEDFQVVRGDTLRNPAFFEGDRLATFDCVIANPPFSLEKWGEDLWLNDPFGRNFAGLPPSSSGDFAWVQHMVKSMAEVTGRMAVVLPQGALFRKGVEGSIRQQLLEMDLVEAVIGLGAQPLLWHRPGRVHPGPAQAQTGQAQEEGADRRCVATVPPWPRAELSGARARRRDPRLVSQALPMCRTGPGWSASTRSRPRTGR